VGSKRGAGGGGGVAAAGGVGAGVGVAAAVAGDEAFTPAVSRIRATASVKPRSKSPALKASVSAALTAFTRSGVNVARADRLGSTQVRRSRFGIRT